MACRNLVRNTICPGMEYEELEVGDRARSSRRGRSVTPRITYLWDENRSLYMDNLRLWDCLTLVRGDPSMTCQSAIKLIFGLSDDEYLRMFPDTKQLMAMMFPGGIIYHTSNEMAMTENARLKHENARLHAAVWVLRDNPSLQADSTVAAIFRLNEAQFMAKFHTEVSVYSMEPASTSSKQQYQNNNKEHRKFFRTSLDLGNEPAMAIHLTNKPLKSKYYTYEKLGCSKSGRRQRSQSLVPPKRQHYDFTSNWKQTTPPEHDVIPRKVRTSVENYLNSDWAVLCWRQNQFFRPVNLYALEGTKSKGDDGHCKQPNNYSQIDETPSESMKYREFRRSNSVSRGGDILDERISKGPSRGPIKCVSFAEPLPSCQDGSPITNEFFCFGDEVKAILDAKNNHSYCHQSKIEDDAPHQAGAVEVNHVLKNDNASMKYNKTEKTSDVYTIAATREPSKKCQKEIATSPVLDTRTRFLILDQSNESKLREQVFNSKGNCMISANDNCMFDNNNNSDNKTTTLSLELLKPDTCTTSARSKVVRPLSPKHRDLHQTRMKNMLSCEKFNNSIKLKRSHDSNNRCSTNNAITEKKHHSIFPAVNVRDGITSIHVPAEQTKYDEEMNKEQEYDDEFGLIRYITNFLNPTTEVRYVQPTIYFSDQRAPAKVTRNTPYFLKSYTTVKHFLDRHQCLLPGKTWYPPQNEVVTKEITPSVEPIAEVKSSSKQEVAAKSGYASSVYTPSIHTERDSGSQNQQFGTKLNKWMKSSDLLIVTPANEASNLQFSYNKPGKPKVCNESSFYNKVERLQELKKLGNYKYTKPLADMIKRNGDYDFKTTHDAAKSTVTIRPSPFPQETMHFSLSGPFITFIPKH